jgi:lipopolysaccharide biosynthesis protein
MKRVVSDEVGNNSGNDSTRDHVEVVAFYLPQFYPFTENNTFWGEGYTEWTAVSRARPLYRGHNQPRQPSDLGFYDLRVPGHFRRQAELAERYGIDAFCIYLYNFSGIFVMDQILTILREEGPLPIRFFFCWANEPWTRRWDGAEHEVLIPQEHDLLTDSQLLINLFDLFDHPSYLKEGGRPLFAVYRAGILGEPQILTQMWRELARERGYPGLELLMVESFGDIDPRHFGFDASIQFPPHGIQASEIANLVDLVGDFDGRVFDYDEAASSALASLAVRQWPRFPGVMLEWDNTARRGVASHSFGNFSISTYAAWLSAALEAAPSTALGKQPRVFINAWNEWAEGTYLEPDANHGMAPLEVVRSAVEENGSVVSQIRSVIERPLVEEDWSTKRARLASLLQPLEAQATVLRIAQHTWPRLMTVLHAVAPSKLSSDSCRISLVQSGRGHIDWLNGFFEEELHAGPGDVLRVDGWMVCGQCEVEGELGDRGLWLADETGNVWFGALSLCGRPDVAESIRECSHPEWAGVRGDVLLGPLETATYKLSLACRHADRWVVANSNRRVSRDNNWRSGL